MSYSKEDIIRMVKEEDVEFIRLQFTDIFGQLKNVAITASQIEKAVNDQVMFDGSSIEGFVRIDESDQYLYPDLDSFAIFPWRPSHGKVAPVSYTHLLELVRTGMVALERGAYTIGDETKEQTEFNPVSYTHLLQRQ